jgi:hypothetical protein
MKNGRNWSVSGPIIAWSAMGLKRLIIGIGRPGMKPISLTGRGVEMGS